MIYSNRTKTRQKISESRDEHTFFCPWLRTGKFAKIKIVCKQHFFCLWLRTGKFAKIKIVCKQQKIINNEVNAFLRKIEQLFLVKSNIDSNRRKTYSIAPKTSSKFRDEHFCADNYFPELLQKTKLCGNDKRAFIIKR
jgi:hypothetical protein